MTTTEQKKTITLDDGPVTIVTKDWPQIAHGRWFSGEHACQAFDEDWLRVREHADGRCIVYGYSGDGDGGSRPKRETRRGGQMLTGAIDRPALVRCMRDVALSLDLHESVVRDAIADLPALDLV